MNNKPEYTIDLDALANLFRKDHKYYKGRFVKLWKDIENLFISGKMISHEEVLREIKGNNGDKDELYLWSVINKEYFLPDYDPSEQAVIGEISILSEKFLNSKTKSPHADPWIIAQAKIKKLTVVTEEVGKGSNVNPNNYGIPDICARLNPKVNFINLRKLIDIENWIY
jgi:hypothetical protein